MANDKSLLTRFYHEERSFREKDTEHYILCLQAGPGSLSLGIFDPGKERFVVLGDWISHQRGIPAYQEGGAEAFRWFFGEVRQEVPLLARPFRETRVAWESPTFTLVPANQYEEGEKESYLVIQSQQADGDEVLTSRIAGFGIMDLFILPGQIREFLETTLGKPALCHISAPLAEGIASEADTLPQGQGAYLNIRDHWFDLVLVRDGKLLLCNLFPWQEPADVAYYLVYTLEQLRLDISTIPVQVTGRIRETDEIFRLLFRYVTHFSLYSPSLPGHLQDLPGRAPVHQWFSLLNLIKCGS